jgi:hypothetical protein
VDHVHNLIINPSEYGFPRKLDQMNIMCKLPEVCSLVLVCFPIQIGFIPCFHVFKCKLCLVFSYIFGKCFLLVYSGSSASKTLSTEVVVEPGAAQGGGLTGGGGGGSWCQVRVRGGGVEKLWV